MKRFLRHRIGFWVNRITLIGLPLVCLGLYLTGTHFDRAALASIFSIWIGFAMNERTFRVTLPMLWRYNTPPTKVIAAMLRPKRNPLARRFFPAAVIKAAYAAAMFGDAVQTDLVVGTHLTPPPDKLGDETTTLQAFIAVMQGQAQQGLALLDEKPLPGDVKAALRRQRAAVRALALVVLERALVEQRLALEHCLQREPFHFYLIAAYGLAVYHQQQGDAVAGEYRAILSGVGRPFKALDPDKCLAVKVSPDEVLIG